MSAKHSREEQTLWEKVGQSESVLEDLELELQSVDVELEALQQRMHNYDVLERACCALEELDGLGATHLFWDERTGPDNPIEHLRNARQKIDEFGAEIARVEEWRQSIMDKIGDQNDALDYLHYDLRDAMEHAEDQRKEWLVEREIDELPYRAQVMPWARGCEEDKRFRKSLGTSLAASLAIAFLAGIIALPIVERTTVDQLPERVAKLVRKEIPKPAPPVEELPAPEEELPEPDPEVAEEQPPDTPVLANVEQPETKEQVKSKGILAFRESFANRANLRPSAQLGSQARVRNTGADAVGRPERLMVASLAPGSSGGINLSDISRDVGGGGGGMDGVALTRVASSIGGGNGPNRPLSGGALAGRTDDEIQIVFDRYKAALYRLYNRELRKDPTLRGQLVLRLTIEPDGTVSLCQLHSSDMEAPTLAQQVVDRVLTFDFGAKEDIVAMTIIYPIDFLPAA